VTISNGAASNRPRVDIKIYRQNVTTDAAASTLTYRIDGAAAKSDWSSYTSAASTLKELIDLINDETNGPASLGVKAWAMHAPYDMSLNLASSYVAASEADILPAQVPGNYTTCLYRDVSAWAYDSAYYAFMRVGLPEPRDRNAFKLVDIYGTIGGTVGAADDVLVYRDEYNDYAAPSGTFADDFAAKEVLVEAAAAASKSYGAGYVAAPDVERAMVVQGPVIVAVKVANNDNVDNVRLNVMIQPIVQG
jgi:hypothetical protein